MMRKPTKRDIGAKLDRSLVYLALAFAAAAALAVILPSPSRFFF